MICNFHATEKSGKPKQLLTGQELPQGFPHGYSEPAFLQTKCCFFKSLLQQSCISHQKGFWQHSQVIQGFFRPVGAWKHGKQLGPSSFVDGRWALRGRLIHNWNCGRRCLGTVLQIHTWKTDIRKFPNLKFLRQFPDTGHTFS